MLVAGLLTVALAGLVAPELEPVYGQTGPRIPTPAPGRPTPIATVPPTVPTVAATVVIVPPSSPGGSAPSGGGAPAAPVATAAPLPTVPGSSATPSAASAAPGAPGPSASGPGGPSAAAVNAPGTSGSSAVPTGGPSALPADDSPNAPPVAVPTPIVGGAAPQQTGPLVAAVVPAAGAGASADGLAVVSSADGAPVRVTVLAPPRADGPFRLVVGAPDPGVLAAISLPGAVVSRAFTVDVTRGDGSAIVTHPKPLTLVVGYADVDLGFAAGDPRRLHVLRWDPDRRVAVVLDTTVDLEAHTLTAQTDHTSLFLIAGVDPTAPREIAARARAPWGADPAPTAPIPSAMPKVGGADATPTLPLGPLAGGALLAAAATATVGVGRRRLGLGRPRRRYAVLGVLIAAALLSLLSPTARLIAATALRLPQLAWTVGGFGGPRTFAVISQSSDEPRPTGGFMGSMGLLTTHDGRVQDFDYRNSLEFDDSRAPLVAPPAPLQRYAGLGGLLLRDANWSPDFATSMEQVDWFFQRDHGVALDGAVALDEDALSVLLAATGPVTIPETGEQVGADDVRRWIAFQLYPLGPDGRPTYSPNAKTQVLSSLSRAVLQRLTHPGLGDVRPFAAAVGQAVREKHVQVWFRSDALERLADAWGAAGLVEDAPGDYLDVVDTSVTVNKIGRYVASRVDYRAEPRPDQGLVHAAVTVTYENRYDAVEARRYYPPFYLSRLYDPRTDRFVDVEGLWATFLRVYAPAGAVLRGSSGLDEPPAVDAELGKSVFGGYVAVGVGERRRVEFEYDLPYRGGPYQLALQRQPGVLRTVSVRVDGKTLYDGPLAEDRSLTAS